MRYGERRCELPAQTPVGTRARNAGSSLRVDEGKTLELFPQPVLLYPKA